MKYQLINQVNPMFTAKEQILYNRGFTTTESQNHYQNLSDNDINDPEVFGGSLLNDAATALKETLNDPSAIIGLTVDSDCDGYTSSAILINYLYDIAPIFTEQNVFWFHHEGKQHGLQDCMEWIDDIGANLVIIPDAGSNDWNQLQILHEQGRKVLILDHHLIEGEAYPNCILINSQLPQYPNKELSGAGVVYQFCRYLDKFFNVDYADQYLDLCALGLIGDMMSLTSYETRWLITKGIQPDRIKNPFIYEMWQKNFFKLGSVPTAWGFTFYIVPFVNAITRSGTMDEKHLVFNSMLKFKAFNEIASNKRGHKLGEMERVVDQAIRTCTNVKNRQGREEIKGLELVEHLIEDNQMMNHKVLLFLLEPGQIPASIRGLIANKLMAKYQRPCCMLTKTIEKDKVSYQGSIRGCDRVGVTNFKDICAETGVIDYVIGHQGAAGLGLPAENVDEFIKRTDIALVNMPNEPIYYVDYIWSPADNTIGQKILDIAAMNAYIGKDFEEPIIAIVEVNITNANIQMMKSNTVKITLPNDVSAIKFNMPDEEYNKLYTENGQVTIDIIGKCSCNNWLGVDYPQIQIIDYNIKEQLAFIF